MHFRSRKPQNLLNAIASSMVFSVIGKGLGYVRQLIIAYNFGILRGLDLYYVAYGMFAATVYSITIVFDQVLTPRFVQIRESESDETFHQNVGSFFTLSIFASVLFALLFILLLPLFIWIFAHGFPESDIPRLKDMAFRFLPWILISFPLATLNSAIKSLKLYQAVIIGDFLVSLTITVVLLVWHTRPEVLPFVMASGAGVSLIWYLIMLGGLRNIFASPWTGQTKLVLKYLGESFLANQFGMLATFVDKFYQSYLLPGSIAGLNYVSSLITPIVDFICFKELYMVPLSESQNREERLSRLLILMLFVNVPLAFYLSIHANFLIEILFQHGHFGHAAKELTVSVMRIWTLTLITSSLGTPAVRLFQVIGHPREIGKVYILSAVFFGILGFVFIMWRKMDAVGWTWTFFLNSAALLIVEFWLLHQRGVRLNWKKIFGFAAYCLIVAGFACLASEVIPKVSSFFANFAISTAAFAAVVSLFYLPLFSTIRKMLINKM